MMEKDLPEGWIEIKIEELTKVVAGGTPSTTKSEYFDGDIPWISPVDLSRYNEKYISKGRRNISELGLKNSSARLMPKGTVLFSSRAPIGYVAIAKNELCTNQGFKSLIPNGSFDSSYAYYYLMHIREYAESQASGTTFKELSGSKMGQLPFLLPPLAEQRRIVAKLDAAFELLDRMKERLARIPELLKTFRQAVLTQAVTGKLTEDWREANGGVETGKQLIDKSYNRRIELLQQSKYKFNKPGPKITTLKKSYPQSWCFSSPGNIAAPEKYSLAIGPFGSNLKVTDYRDTGVPLVFVRHIKANDFVGNNPKFVDQEKAEELNPHSIEGLDLVITKMGEPPGDCEIYPENLPKAIITSDCLKFRVWSVFYERQFYKLAINSTFVKDQLGLITKGVAQQKISLARFKEIHLPVPPLAEQQEIVRRVEALLAKADALEAQYLRLKEKIDRLPQALLAQAFRGELVPQDPNDEPAGVLLGKIKGATKGKQGVLGF